MKGFCFLGEPEQGKRHLKIILTEPNRDKLVVVVSVATLRPKKRQDLSCVLKEGDHPFIRHDSIVDFEKAVAMPAPDILERQFSGDFAPMPDMPPAVFARVLAAAAASRKMRPRIKSMLFSAV